MVETLGVGKGTATLEDMESTGLIFIFGNNPGTNHPRMLTSLQKAKEQGAKIIVVNPLPEVGMMRVTNPNPQDYKNPLELPIALLGKDQALADLYRPVRDTQRRPHRSMRLLSHARNRIHWACERAESDYGLLSRLHSFALRKHGLRPDEFLLTRSIWWSRRIEAACRLCESFLDSSQTKLHLVKT